MLISTLRDGDSLPPAEPVQRVFDYLDRVVVIVESLQPFPTCLVGVLTLEMAAAIPAFRAAAQSSFDQWLGDVEHLIGDALAASKKPHLNAQGIAEFFVATLEGSLILARAREDRTIIERNVGAFKSYLRAALA